MGTFQDAVNEHGWQEYGTYDDSDGRHNNTNRVLIAQSDYDNVKGKEELVRSLERQQNETEAMAKQFASGAPLVNTLSNQRLAAQQAGLTYRSAVQNAAERGLVHSGVLGQIQSGNALNLAQKYMAMLADDETSRRQRLNQIEQQQAVSKATRQQIPEEVTVVAGGFGGVQDKADVATYEKERAAIDRSQKEVDRLIGVLSTHNLDEGELLNRFKQSIDSTFDQAEALSLQEAQRRGFSEDAVRGIQGRFQYERQQAYDVAAGVAAGVTKTTPEEMKSTLAALYNPDVVPMVDVTRRDPSGVMGLFGGILGAAIGGYATGGVAGVAPGYSIGSGVGNGVEALLYG